MALPTGSEVTNQQTTSKLTQADLRQFSGNLVKYQHALNPNVIYTPGIQYLAETAPAFWLVDTIVSYFDTDLMRKAMEQDDRVKSMQFWRLDVKDEAGILTARADDGVEPFVRQEIPFTDFPLDHVDVWAGFGGCYWTLYLPSER